MGPVIRHQWFMILIDLYSSVKMEILLVYETDLSKKTKPLFEYIFIHLIIKYIEVSRNVKENHVELY